MKDRKAQPHKITQRFIPRNPHGEENPAKIPLYKMYKRQPPKQVFFSFYYVFLSLLCATQVSEFYVLMRNTTPLFIHFMSTDFNPQQDDPTKLHGPTSPRKTQNSILYYSLGY